VAHTTQLSYGGLEPSDGWTKKISPAVENLGYSRKQSLMQPAVGTPNVNKRDLTFAVTQWHLAHLYASLHKASLGYVYRVDLVKQKRGIKSRKQRTHRVGQIHHQATQLPENPLSSHTAPRETHNIAPSRQLSPRGDELGGRVNSPRDENK
jgi:hypothetical protein